MDILTNNNFDDKTQHGVVLIDVFAKWCSPCHVLSRIIDDVCKDFENDEAISIYKVDADEQPEIAKKFNVISIPTLIFMKDGEFVKAVTGVQTKTVISKALSDLNAM